MLMVLRCKSMWKRIEDSIKIATEIRSTTSLRQLTFLFHLTVFSIIGNHEKWQRRNGDYIKMITKANQHHHNRVAIFILPILSTTVEVLHLNCLNAAFFSTTYMQYKYLQFIHDDATSTLLRCEWKKYIYICIYV